MLSNLGQLALAASFMSSAVSNHINYKKRIEAENKCARGEVQYDFRRQYIWDEEKTLDALEMYYIHNPYIVPCAGMRYVNTKPEMSIELIDYTGDQRVIPVSKILAAISESKITVINAAQVRNYGIILRDLK